MVKVRGNHVFFNTLYIGVDNDTKLPIVIMRGKYVKI